MEANRFLINRKFLVDETYLFAPFLPSVWLTGLMAFFLVLTTITFATNINRKVMDIAWNISFSQKNLKIWPDFISRNLITAWALSSYIGKVNILVLRSKLLRVA